MNPLPDLRKKKTFLKNFYIHYEKKNLNNDGHNSPSHINKTNNHLSPQIIKHKKHHDIWCWKST
jgi:hypothetical protein